MMQRTLAHALPTIPIGERVAVQGWVHRRRRLGGIAFLVVRDRTGLAQAVVAGDAAGRLFADVPEETVVTVEGSIAANGKAPGGVELIEPVITTLSPPALPPPVELWRPPSEVSLPVLLDHAPVLWRHPAQSMMWRIAAASLRGFRALLDRRGFVEIQTPKIVGSATESGANVFELDYFGRAAYLAQSPQLYKQMMVGVFERVYETGPVFRAEPHDTARHLAEYVSLDVEFGFIHDHRDVLAVLRDVLQTMLTEVTETVQTTASSGIHLPSVPEEIPVIHFRDALALVGAGPDEPDLAPDHERRLGEWARREHGSEFLAVEGYPAVKRPFYTQPEPGDPRWTNSFDLLFRGLELCTGGQRLHTADAYEHALAQRGESATDYEPYVQAFRHGMPPHGGFAIGLERWVARLTGTDNIRRAALFPRDLNRLSP
ncbi:nondiscriminating aspartyl-tRNA synthetase [Nocardia sp. GAS34]|uniref:aspartate--tRNA(Asn) ligase n=1 Tax=unclassified Nocardia TaxID=2637762 RepID=UPI003D24A102